MLVKCTSILSVTNTAKVSLTQGRMFLPTHNNATMILSMPCVFVVVVVIVANFKFPRKQANYKLVSLSSYRRNIFILQ